MACCVYLMGDPKLDIESETIIKQQTQWTTEEEKLENANSKDLYAIFCGIDMQKFRRIVKCIVAKTSWDILDTTHEGCKRCKF
ncbi:hypothetical protein J1N35_007598 [Gossypium stocksii]|uniref:Uncharacterized protein n=1 Tax=Gossypium stocksii TaxID=47602 RepID=A0A9D3W9H8_9ROSI|nr:hypothetical protein J1N35_007598 [Gossypium stocksii]